MKDQFHPVRSNAECEGIIEGTYKGVLSMAACSGHGDHEHGEDLLDRTEMIILEVEGMTARREYDDSTTDYWYWEPATAQPASDGEGR